MAAGRSLRVGSPKALLRFRGRSFLDRVAGNLHESHELEDLIVVTGAFEKEVTAEAGKLNLRTAHDANFAAGMMSSLQLGISLVPESADAVLVALVDQPFIGPETIEKLIQLSSRSFTNPQNALCRPFYRETPGHPCLIGRSYFKEILDQQGADRGAAFLFWRHPERVVRFLTEDSEVIRNFDRPEVLQRGLDAL